MDISKLATALFELRNHVVIGPAHDIYRPDSDMLVFRHTPQTPLPAAAQHFLQLLLNEADMSACQPDAVCAVEAGLKNPDSFSCSPSYRLYTCFRVALYGISEPVGEHAWELQFWTFRPLCFEIRGAVESDGLLHYELLLPEDGADVSEEDSWYGQVIGRSNGEVPPLYPEVPAPRESAELACLDEEVIRRAYENLFWAEE